MPYDDPIPQEPQYVAPSQPGGAFVSLKEVVHSWLLKHEKPIHSYLKAAVFGAAGLRELSTHSLKLVKHVLITREEGRGYWNLPADFLDWVSVGIRTGEYWRPVGVSTNGTMPYLPQGGPFDDTFGQEFDSSPASWLEVDGNPASGYYHMYGMSPYHGSMPGYTSYGAGSLRVDTVAFDVESGAIMAPVSFPATELYLVYVGYGAADARTQLPRKAQACLEAYITWQWYQVKRAEQSKARYYQEEYGHQIRLLRASNNDLTVTDIKRLMERSYSRLK